MLVVAKLGTGHTGNYVMCCVAATTSSKVQEYIIIRVDTLLNL